MAVLVTMEFEGTPDQYDAVNAALDVSNNPPDGFISHTAQDVGGKLRIVDVWESAEAFGAFAQSKLGPTIAETLGDEAPPSPQPEFTELHNAYGA